MEGKKISFSFMKTKKLEKLPLQEKKDFIECVEEKSIKVVGGEEVKEIVPLVIPMKPNTLITSERLKEIAEKVESALEEPETVEVAPKPHVTVPENETLEQMAVRELLEDSKKEVKVDMPQLTLLLPSKSVSSGEKESTLDDYDSVPVQEFGLAMLRGMGWTKTTDKSTFKPPQLRPKGLGLGADKVVKDKQKVTKNSKDGELTIVKNAYVKITSGKYSSYYGKVLSLDDDNGRVMVDITVKKETVSLSEFMMHPVSKSEFDKESKVINANSFEQYKKNEGQTSSKNSEKESSSKEDRNNRNENSKHERESNDNNNHRGTEKEKQVNKEKNRERTNRERHRDSSDEKYRKNNRESSQESLSDSDSRRKYKKEWKGRKQYSSNESLNSDTERLYKKKERRRGSDTESNRRKKSDKEQKRQGTDDIRGKRSDERRRLDSDLESDRNSKKIEKERRYSSDSESKERRYSSDSESDNRSKKKKEKERRRRDSDSDQRRSKRSDTPDGKRDIDKKRKGKKKKRDRDRSPNYRKHRK